MNIKISIISILFFFSLNLFSQNDKKLDSLLQVYSIEKVDTTKIKTMREIVKLQVLVKPKMAEKYAKEMIALSKKNNYKRGLVSGYNGVGTSFYYQGLLDSAIVNVKKAILLNTKNTDEDFLLLSGSNLLLTATYFAKNEFDSTFHYANKNIDLYDTRDSWSTKQKEMIESMGATYNLLGMFYFSLSKYDLALKYQLKSLKIFNENGQGLSTSAGVTKNSLALIELRLKNYKQAIIYFNDVILNHSQKNPYLTTTLMNNRAQAYIRLDEVDRALADLKKCISLAKEIDSKILEARVWAATISPYITLGKGKEALKSFKMSLKLYKNLNMEVPCETYILIANYYRVNKQFDNALYYYNKAINSSELQHSLDNSCTTYYNRHLVYKELKNYKKSLEDYTVAMKLNDSIFTKTQSQQIEELKISYETEKKEQKIQIQNKEIDILKIEEKMNSMQRLLLAFGLLIALIGVYAFYQRNKINKIAKEKAENNLKFKTKELTTHALHLAKKNEVLNDIKQKAEVFKSGDNYTPGYQTLIQTINFDIQDDNSWETFSKYFEEVHTDFNAKSQKQFPNITSNDLRLMRLMKMNLSSKEIANILSISPDGIKKSRQRLRKKMNLEPSDSLEKVIISI